MRQNRLQAGGLLYHGWHQPLSATPTPSRRPGVAEQVAQVVHHLLVGGDGEVGLDAAGARAVLDVQQEAATNPSGLRLCGSCRGRGRPDARLSRPIAGAAHGRPAALMFVGQEDQNDQAETAHQAKQAEPAGVALPNAIVDAAPDEQHNAGQRNHTAEHQQGGTRV